jgi:hypothetical protein
MVEGMGDDTRQPGPLPAPRSFVQLALPPTVIGPGMRTEDHYEPGTRLKVEGQRGSFTYRYATVSRAGLVSLHLTQDGVFRAARPDQVTLLRKPRARR